MEALHPSIADTNISRIPLGGWLYTPPEHTVDSFTSSRSDEPDNDHYHEQWRKAVESSKDTLLPPLARTPPASPYQAALPSISSAAGYSVPDAPLFPRQPSNERAHSQPPLFEPSTSPAPVQSIERVKPAHSLEQPPNNPQPRSKIFPWSLGLKTDQEKLDYFRKVNGEALRMGRRLPVPKQSHSSQRTPEDARQIDSLTRSLTQAAGVSKPRSASKAVPRPKAPLATSSPNAAPRKSRAPSKTKAAMIFDDAWPREKNSKNTRAPASKKVEEKPWTDLPDYAPPVADLDTNSKQLKVSWKGKPKPLEETAALAQLHPQELALAEELCLGQAEKYLANKRRIFVSRVQHLRDGKNFTKTAAQTACSVDVNKASQLFVAFDRIGWFEPHWFTQYI